MEVQLTLFQLVGGRGEDYAHHITTYMKVTYVGEGEDYAYHITAYMNIFSQSLSWGRD